MPRFGDTIPSVSLSSMKMRRYTRVSMAGFMAVWLSGVLLLLCCQKINGASTTAEFCPLQQKSSHCKRAKKSDSPFIETSSTHDAGCCLILPAVFDKVRKMESGKAVVQPAAKARVEPVEFVPVLATFAPLTVFSRIESRQGTYLQNCNFRI